MRMPSRSSLLETCICATRWRGAPPPPSLMSSSLPRAGMVGHRGGRPAAQADHRGRRILRPQAPAFLWWPSLIELRSHPARPLPSAPRRRAVEPSCAARRPSPIVCTHALPLPVPGASADRAPLYSCNHPPLERWHGQWAAKAGEGANGVPGRGEGPRHEGHGLERERPSDPSSEGGSEQAVILEQ